MGRKRALAGGDCEDCEIISFFFLRLFFYSHSLLFSFLPLSLLLLASVLFSLLFLFLFIFLIPYSE